MSEHTEQWGPTPSEHHRVSDLGNVWSEHSRRLLKPQTLASGYQLVYLGKHDGKRLQFYVHRLVLEAFVGPCPEGTVACHWDDDKSNNRLDNLRWGSPKREQPRLCAEWDAYQREPHTLPLGA